MQGCVEFSLHPFRHATPPCTRAGRDRDRSPEPSPHESDSSLGLGPELDPHPDPSPGSGPVTDPEHDPKPDPGPNLTLTLYPTGTHRKKRSGSARNRASSGMDNGSDLLEVVNGVRVRVNVRVLGLGLMLGNPNINPNPTFNRNPEYASPSCPKLLLILPAQSLSAVSPPFTAAGATAGQVRAGHGRWRPGLVRVCQI